MATKEQQDAHAADYADQFNAPEQAPRQQSDEEAFGLTEPAADAPAEGSPAEEAGEPPAAEAAEEPAGEGTPAEQASEAAPAEAAPSPADAEQRLKSWEGRLKARQAELDAREAAMGSSSANEEQASLPMGEGDDDEGNESDAVEKAEASTPGQVLAADFGEDFVDQITALIQQVCGECMGGVSGKVDQVISDLQNDRLQNHFNTIAASHADFMDVVESPDFAAWKASQPDQDALQKVIDGGSARQIIAMLTRFKESRGADKGSDSGSGSDYGDDDALDAAEGVRSSGVSLPQEPAASDDFAKAWNEA